MVRSGPRRSDCEVRVKIFLPAILIAQRILLVAAFQWYRVFDRRSRRDSIDWVVGADELASLVHQIRQALPGSYSVSFTQDGTYQLDYDYSYREASSPRRRAWRKLLFGPVVLARLANRARGFIYVGPTGFLMEGFDERGFEFRFLKRHGRRIATYWCGSEIRSPRKMRELEEETGLPNVFTYIGLIAPGYLTDRHERMLERRAQVANRYADVQFDFPTDQRSYIEGYREPFFYYMPEDRFATATDKFEDLSQIVVTHATTSPVIKGTQLVRAAVARLREEGYDFEYVEFVRGDHGELLEQLRRTHIALNQFYGFTTAVFGIEAMAARCAVLSSADETIETLLPPGNNRVSLVTRHWQVYENLRSLLDHPERLEPLATSAQEWVRRYASTESAGRLLGGILDSVLDGSYDRQARARLTIGEVYGDPAEADSVATP